MAIDIGCGTGRNMRILGRHASFVFGLDRSSVALQIAAHEKLSVAQADAHTLPLSEDSVDLISALDVLEHLDDDMKALDEFRRVLRPNGFLLISVPAYRFLWSEHDEALMHRRRYVASELHIKLDKAGFVVLKRTYAVFFAFWPILLFRLFRGIFPKDPFAPKASHVKVPAILNSFLSYLLKFESIIIGATNIPMGTSIILVAQKPTATPVIAEA